MHGMARSVQNPDLNRIENVWRKMKIELQKRVHKITTVALLEGDIRDIWTENAVEFLQNLYESNPKRIKQVIKAKENKVLGKF